MANAHLIVLPASGEPYAAALGDGDTVIGSSAKATIRIADPALAACHAVIHRENGTAIIARHATPFLVNGLKARQHVLTPFDLISLGQTALSFRHGEPAARAADDTSPALALCRRLNDFTRRVAEGADESELTRVLLEDVVRLTAASQGALVLFGADGARSLSLAEGRRGEFTAEDASFSRTLVARIRDTGQPLLVSDLAHDADLAIAASLQASSTRAVMCAPVTLEERVIGALYVGSSRPFSRAHLELLTLYAHHAVHVVAAAERDRTLTAELARVERQPTSALVGGSPAMTAVATQIRKVASHDIGVLIRGETGTGKEVVAREIHRIGARADAPFVAVDCGAIAEGLFESEMFGHKKGAFTHAYQDRAGWIRRAHGGTLFLDEIGELTPAHQAKLLRVLQERVVTPVGGEQSHEVDFRLLCATNRDLDREGSFRRDLFYRIAGVSIMLPPLRDRDEDVIELAHHFLRRHGDSLGRRELRFAAAALTAMRKYAWPGNVRELEAAVRKAVVLCEGDALMPGDLGLQHVEPSREILPLAVVRDRHLKRYVQDVVDRLHGNRAEAAKQLMVSVRTVFKYLEEV